jgi:ketosteroid isomerase-like protein
VSGPNAEITRRCVDAWNPRDVEALLALSDPEIEFVNSSTAVEPGTRHGYDRITAVLRTQWEFLTDGRMEIDRIYDRGERVIVLCRASRRMPGSDARLEDQGLGSFTIRDGKVVRVEVLAFGSSEVQDALKAAGLSE